MLSSSDEGINPPVPKKRDVLRACDICRRRKVKCDGPSKRKKTCSNCSSGNVECTYKHGAIKRGPSKKYIERLEDRLNKMEDLFRKFCPGVNIDRELGPRPQDEAGLCENYRDGGTRATSSDLHSQGSPADPPNARLPSLPSVPSAGETEGESDDDIRSGPTFLANWLKFVQINPAAPRHFGSASSHALIRSTFELKNEDSVDTRTPLEILQCMAKRRPEYWYMIPSEARDLQDYDHSLDNPHFEFPEEDLIPVLVNKYFEEINAYWPLLHRPTFEAELDSKAHYRDKSFAAVLLTICALGARFLDDPRVLQDGLVGVQSPGWKWFRQASVMRRSPWASPSLYDLQLYGLIARYMVCTSNRQGFWMMVGTGIRLAQDIGVHRRKIFNTVLTPRDELWKRAFWALIDLDRTFASYFGRSCVLQDEDFDIDMPVECDDEYWEGPTPFLQPPDKPSKMSYFICLLKLNQILALTLRTMYSINKSKAALGFIGLRKELELVAHLDLAMNKWLESLPNHLRWDPNREDPLFFSQSALLQTSYYALQITVHRPFITSTRGTPKQSFSSLAICANAARALSHVLGIEQKRMKKPLSYQMHHAFIAGIVLLMAIYRSKKNGLHLDPAKELADVHTCMSVLKALEPRWHVAGRLWDILSELSSVGDLSMLRGSGLKRQRRDGKSADDGQSGVSLARDTRPSAPGAFSSSSGATAKLIAPGSIPSRPQFAGSAIPPSAPPTAPFGHPPVGMDPMYQELLADLSTPLPPVPDAGDSSAAQYFGAIDQDLLASLYAPSKLGTQQSSFDPMQAVGAGLNPGILPYDMVLPPDLSTLFDMDAFSLPDMHTESAPLQPPTALNSTQFGEWEWFFHATNGYPEYQPRLQSQPQPASYAQSVNACNFMDGLSL